MFFSKVRKCTVSLTLSIPRNKPEALLTKEIVMHEQPFEKILADFEPLIKGQLKKLNLYRQHDEYYHIGVIALWEAYRNYEQGKGSFAAYALHTVRGNMLMMLRREQRFAERHVLQDEQTSADFIRPDPTATNDMDTTLSALTPYLRHLSPREKLWVREAILFEKKLGEIAREQAVSTNTVASWRKQALRKMRANLAASTQENGEV